MMYAASMLGVVLGLGPTTTEPAGDEPSAEPPVDEATSAPVDDDEASAEAEVSTADAVLLLETAQRVEAGGNFEAALGIIAQALALDPSLAAAYLQRAQSIIARLGDLDAIPPEGPGWDEPTIARARMAADDLLRYVELSGMSPGEAEWLEQMRTRLLGAAQQAEDALNPPVVEPLAPPQPSPPEPRDRGPRRWYTDPLGGALGGLGLVTAAGGVTAMVIGRRRHADAAGLTSEQGFADQRGSARTVDAVGIGLVSAGGALLAGAVVRYVLVARRGTTRAAVVQPSPGGLTLRW